MIDIPAPATVFRIINRATGKPEGVYTRSYHNEINFSSPESALHANCHGIHKDHTRYTIAKYRVVYELIDADVTSTHD